MAAAVSTVLTQLQAVWVIVAVLGGDVVAVLALTAG